jgi:hypothetical protein
MVSQARISVNSQKACKQLYKTVEKTAPKQKMWQKVSPNKFFPLIHKTILTQKKKGIKKNWHFFSSKIMEYVTYYSFTF